MNRIPQFLVSVIFVTNAAACGSQAEFDREGIPRSDATPISVSDVLEQSETFAGKRLTLGGKVVDVWSRRVFSVTGQQYLDSDSLLVISDPRPNGSAVDAAGITDVGVRVQVGGTLHTGESDTLAREFGVDLSQVPPHLRNPIFVADEVTIAPAAR